ncbi:MAG TPA: glycosyltransferase family 8 protein [Fontimonas sp.]
MTAAGGSTRAARLVVACAADQPYLPHCATTLLSLLEHHPDADIHLLHPASVDAAELQRLRDMVGRGAARLTTHEVQADAIEGLPRLSEVTITMWLRALLPALLPDHSRVLYIDCDTLVVDDLSALWATDLDGVGVGAVRNILPAAARDYPLSVGVPVDAYFNSGVLLINLDYWRAQRVTEALLAFGRARAGQLKWPDQDALNHVLRDAWRALPERYNAQNGMWFMPNRHDYFSRAALRAATGAPAIVHFEGPHLVKPWGAYCKNPYRARYFELRRRTPWPTLAAQPRPPLWWLTWLPASLLYPLLGYRARLVGAWQRRRA